MDQVEDVSIDTLNLYTFSALFKWSPLFEDIFNEQLIDGD